MKKLIILVLITCLAGCNHQVDDADEENIIKGNFKRAKLSELSGLILPKEIDAGHIAFYADGTQELELFMSFNVPLHRIDKCIDSFLKISSSRSLLKVSPVRKPLAKSLLITVHDRLRPLKWWQIDQIKNGFYIGQNDAYTLHLWYDVTNNILYLYSTD